jgi:hypothetical protein
MVGPPARAWPREWARPWSGQVSAERGDRLRRRPGCLYSWDREERCEYEKFHNAGAAPWGRKGYKVAAERGLRTGTCAVVPTLAPASRRRRPRPSSCAVLGQRARAKKYQVLVLIQPSGYEPHSPIGATGLRPRRRKLDTITGARKWTSPTGLPKGPDERRSVANHPLVIRAARRTSSWPARLSYEVEGRKVGLTFASYSPSRWRRAS